MAAQKRTLFDFDQTLSLHDLTSTHVEYECNPHAKSGHLRDHLPDWTHVVLVLVRKDMAELARRGDRESLGLPRLS